MSEAAELEESPESTVPWVHHGTLRADFDLGSDTECDDCGSSFDHLIYMYRPVTKEHDISISVGCHGGSNLVTNVTSAAIDSLRRAREDFAGAADQIDALIKSVLLLGGLTVNNAGGEALRFEDVYLGDSDIIEVDYDPHRRLFRVAFVIDWATIVEHRDVLPATAIELVGRYLGNKTVFTDDALNSLIAAIRALSS